MSKLTGRIRDLTHLALARDPGSRALQQAGIIRFLLIFVQGVVLVKAGIPLAIVGQVEFVFFLANFMMFYWQSGGQNGMLSWVPGGDTPGGFGKKLGAVFISVHLFAIVAAALLGIALQFQVIRQASEAISTNTVWLLAIYVVFTLPTSPIIYNYLLNRHYKRILNYIGASYALQVASVLVPFLLGYGIDTMMMCLAGFAALRWIFVVYDGKWFRDGMPSRQLVGMFIVFSLPLVLHALNSGLMDYVDGWIVSGYFGDETFAVYRYGAKELPFNALLIGGLLTGMIPKFSEQGQVNALEVRGEMRKLIRTLFPLNCLLILLSPLIYPLVYSDDFIISARIFNIYALTLLSRIVINQVYLYVGKLNWVLALSTAGEIVINVMLSLVFLRYFGLLGIPLATVIAYGVHKLFMVFYIKFYLGVNAERYLPLLDFFLASVLMLMSFLIAELIYF